MVLPASIRRSKVLSGEHFELLSTVDEVPVIDPSFEDDRLKNIFQYYAVTPEEMDLEVHKYVVELLSQRKIWEAWQVLLTSEIA